MAPAPPPVASPDRAIDGAQSLLNQGVRYIIGPNVDTTAAVIVPLLRTGNAINIAYGDRPIMIAIPCERMYCSFRRAYEIAIYIHQMKHRNTFRTFITLVLLCFQYIFLRYCPTII